MSALTLDVEIRCVWKSRMLISEADIDIRFTYFWVQYFFYSCLLCILSLWLFYVLYDFLSYKYSFINYNFVYIFTKSIMGTRKM